jgi:hypothetical protein
VHDKFSVYREDEGEGSFEAVVPIHQTRPRHVPEYRKIDLLLTV